MKRLASVLMLTSALGSTAAFAQLPVGGQVTAGSGAISANGANMTVNQSSGTMAIDWNSFSIGAGNKVKFVQPSATSSVLNRVLGNDVSVIQGSISANGRVFLVNQNGILFAPGAQVNVGGLVASTLAIKTEDFLSGKYDFSGTGGTVTNQGAINAPGGTVALIAAKISNTGSIQANGGSVLLGAGNEVVLDLGGPVKLSIKKSAIDALIENGGAIQADGGTILLSASAATNLAASVINNTGLIEARTLSTGQKGDIQLLGGNASIQVGGTLDASAPKGGDGGTIETSAGLVNVSEHVNVDTSSLRGQIGTWTLDPDVIQIVSGSHGDLDRLPDDGTTQIGTTTLNNALRNTDINLQADQLIDFQTDFTYSGSRNAGLNLYAPTIRLGGDIDATNAKLDLALGGTFKSKHYDGNLYVDGGSRKIDTNGGDLTLNGDVGGGGNLTIDTGYGSFTNKSSIDGSFDVTKSRTDDLSISFDPGSDHYHDDDDASVVVDFSAGSLKVDGHTKTYSGTIPDSAVSFGGGTVLQLDAKSGTHVTLTLSGGGTKTLDVSHGNVTIPHDGLVVTKISYTVDGGDRAQISADNIAYTTTAQAGKLNNLVVKTGTLNLSHSIAVAGSADLVTRHIINDAGSHPITVGPGKTWRIWSTNSDPFDDRDGDQLDGLDYDYKQYNATYGDTTPAGQGDGLLFSYAPVLTLTVTGPVGKTYDGSADADLSWDNYSLSGAVDGDSVTVTKPSSGTFTSNGNANANAGSHRDVTVSDISVTGAKNGEAKVYGYRINNEAVGRGIGTIDPRPITLTADSASKTYGDQDPDLDVSVSRWSGDGLAHGDSLYDVTGHLTREHGEDAGHYSIELGDGDEARNYSISFDTHNHAFTIDPRLILLLADSTGKTYGNWDPDLDVSVSHNVGDGLAHGDSLYDVTGHLTREHGEDVGHYDIELGKGDEARNYTILFDTHNDAFTISPRHITLVANSASKTYGDNDPTLGVSVSRWSGDGLAHGDSLYDVTGHLTRYHGENVGTYSIELGKGDEARNYSISFDTHNRAFTIDPRLILLLADSASKTYGDNDPSLDVTVSHYVGRGLANGDSLYDVTGKMTRQYGENVGTYSIELGKGGKSGNYRILFNPHNKAFTIDPRLITLIADSAGKTYGDADPTLGVKVSGTDGRGLGNGDTIADVAGTVTRAAGENVGTYSLQLGEGDKAGNYVITFDTANKAFTIDPRLITLVANSAGKTYGDADPTLGVKVSGTDGRGLGNGDTVADVAGTVTRAAGENVGTYSLQLGEGDKAGNYVITFDTANKAFTIDPRLITLVANSAGKTYGDADPTLGVKVSGADGQGLANGDTVADVAGTVTRATGENVGTYSLKLGSGDKAGNYIVTFDTANKAFTIDPRLITLLSTQAGKIYGDADPALGVTVSGAAGRGLANGDTLADVAGTVTRETGENLGNYNLLLGSGTKAGNYAITFDTANQAFTINAANIDTQQYLPKPATTPQLINTNTGTPSGTPGAGGLNYQAVNNGPDGTQGSSDGTGGSDGGNREAGAISPTGSTSNPLDVLVVDGGVNTSTDSTVQPQ